MKIMAWAGISTGALAFVTLLGCLVGHMLKRLDETAIPDRRG